MDPTTIGAIGFVVVLLLLVLRVPIGFALAAVATICVFLVYAWRPGRAFNFDRGINPTLSLVHSNAFDFLHSYSLSMVPMFIAAGHIAYHARITTDIYNAMRIWMASVPGGLAIASLFGCGGFSAITGSSMACASSMGRICVPEMLRWGYKPSLAGSTVAMGGTLGALIPPSILFVLYALFTEQSVSRLFLAGIIPGLLSLAGYIITVMIWVRMNPAVAPKVEMTFTGREKLRAVLIAWPAAALMTIIIGGIYGGIFTATEAAAVSLGFALTFGIVSRRLTWAAIIDSFVITAKSSAALFFIAVGAKIFVSLVSLTGVTQAFVDLIQSSNLAQWQVLTCIVLLYLVLGVFLDPIGTMLLTLPFVIPLVEGYGLDLVWFGVIVVKLLEIGLVTPPMGLNVFVVASVAGKEVDATTTFKGVARFLTGDLVVLALLVAFPILSLFVPNSMN
ncbi:TRAP transporter, DctM subunit [Gemmobacter megaterium]|uniref:TRAP transporter large permease protein n=1 Tax=Gemmobacter megaterium TaxID=1086013 RepID=A0A1N7Q740_9RHOB|nr:TRAP transporter large permease [Gemmobacter megaterium]GGE23677.1 C4-dicarboxylate ABC transporter [Gemmobacter megaterium]SIT18678.1 TRAP transporter, DctM subunit [Gemmobacter megaterium]